MTDGDPGRVRTANKPPSKSRQIPYEPVVHQLPSIRTIVAIANVPAGPLCECPRRQSSI